MLHVSPGLVLAVLMALIATQSTRLLLPGRGPYLWTLLLSIAGLLGGELLARSGHLGAPALGVLHPLADLVVVALLQMVGALLLAPPAQGRPARR